MDSKTDDDQIAGDPAWDPVDWEETIKQAEDVGTSDAKKKVSTSAKEIYKKTDVIARAHGQVMDPYQLADDRKGGCGRPSERSVKRGNYLINAHIRRK